MSLQELNNNHLELSDLRLWGHRAFGDELVQNCLCAFKAAAKSKMNGIETDIFLTKDKQPIVIHGDTENGYAALRPIGSDEPYKMLLLTSFTFEEVI